MKEVTICLLVFACFSSCSTKKQSIDFVALQASDFNSAPFDLPSGQLPASAKQAHDSCMGFSFDANAILIRTGDTFFIGSVVNRQSLAVIRRSNELGLTQKQLISQFNVISEPCYEKKVLNFPLRSILGENFSLQLPGADESTNRKINEVLQTSVIDEIESGPWVYVDMKGVLKNILDTVMSDDGLRYKSAALDSANMVLTSLEAVTYLTFVIHTKDEISPSLQAALKSEPFVPFPKATFTIQLFYSNSKEIKMAVNGFFPAAGQFMRVITK